MTEQNVDYIHNTCMGNYSPPAGYKKAKIEDIEILHKLYVKYTKKIFSIPAVFSATI